MAQKDNTKQNNPMPLNELPIQRIEDITKQIISKVNNPFDEVNKQIIDRMNKDREDAQYSKEQVLQMRENNDSRLYKTPEDANRINAGGYVWENGKVGYFIPFQHRGLGFDFLPSQFGGSLKDGKGLRFVQVHKNSSKPFAYPQSNDVTISGFGEYVLGNWGKDLSKLCSEYTNGKYKKRVAQWRKDNYPAKMDKQTALKLLIDLKNAECDQWNKATISEFFTANDNEKLNQCMNEYFNWFDNCMQTENEKEEKDFIKFIKSATISNSWVNGKSGNFKDFDNNCLYRFLETDENLYSYLLEEQEQRNMPVLACGFVGWLIKHWGKTPKEIFEGYFLAKLTQHKKSHEKDLDSWKPDFNSRIEQEFYANHRTDEEQWAKQSEAIFDFISDAEVQRIKGYVNNYFEYVGQFETVPEENKVEIPKANTNKPNAGKPQQNFTDYLHHHNTDALKQKLHELLDNKKAKTVAVTIKALIDLSYLAGYDSKNNLYNTMRTEFSFSGTNSALNKFLNSNTDNLTETDIKPTKEILQSVK